MDTTAEELNQRAIASYGAGLRDEAISQWQAALSHAPEYWEVMIYLASALKERGDTATAGDLYQQALSFQPALPEVHYNLGNIRQAQGRLGEAEAAYRQALAHKADFAFAWYNLGNLYLDQGKLQDAVDHFKQAILNAPGHAPSYNNLGNALLHQGELALAAQCYQAALDNQPDYPDARYNLGNALFQQGEFAQALEHFQRAGIRDSQARALYCEYKCERFPSFTDHLEALCESGPHRSPQVATLAAHAAINFGVDNPYRFCPQPFECVWHQSLPELAAGSPLRQDLLEAMSTAGIEERLQGRLHNGVQSAGNLFHREEAAFQQLAELVREQFRAYHARYATADCEMIRSFPRSLDFESAWYIRMRQGGHLDAHIHEGGWVSGVVYLAMPPRPSGTDDGCLELGLHGDNYPVAAGAGDFERRVIPVEAGDMVLFPANLFHRTLPFRADAERICVAFDLKPAAGVR